jgi:hypothetical protein
MLTPEAMASATAMMGGRGFPTLPFMPAAAAAPAAARAPGVRLEDLDRILAGMFPTAEGAPAAAAAVVPAPAAAAAAAAAAAPAAAAAAAVVRPLPDASLYTAQLTQLHEMGFTDDVRARVHPRV